VIADNASNPQLSDSDIIIKNENFPELQVDNQNTENNGQKLNK
jgi:hypothetical protein